MQPLFGCISANQPSSAEDSEKALGGSLKLGEGIKIIQSRYQNNCLSRGAGYTASSIEAAGDFNILRSNLLHNRCDSSGCSNACPKGEIIRPISISCFVEMVSDDSISARPLKPAGSLSAFSRDRRSIDGDEMPKKKSSNSRGVAGLGFTLNRVKREKYNVINTKRGQAKITELVLLRPHL